MAQRAKKILQEEGSHRIHAEAWARRMCASEHESELLRAQVEADWNEVSRWLGPAGDGGAGAALELGMLTADVAAQREQMRSWLGDLFDACGVELKLSSPGDFSGWDAERRRLEP